MGTVPCSLILWRQEQIQDFVKGCVGQQLAMQRWLHPCSQLLSSPPPSLGWADQAMRAAARDFLKVPDSGKNLPASWYGTPSTPLHAQWHLLSFPFLFTSSPTCHCHCPRLTLRRGELKRHFCPALTGSCGDLGSAGESVSSSSQVPSC